MKKLLSLLVVGSLAVIPSLAFAYGKSKEEKHKMEHHDAKKHKDEKHHEKHMKKETTHHEAKKEMKKEHRHKMKSHHPKAEEGNGY